MLINKVTLFQLIELNKAIKPLDNDYNDVVNSEVLSDVKRNILLTGIFVKKAQKTFEAFGEESTLDIKTIGVDSLILWYTEFTKFFEIPLEGNWWKEIGLSEPELTHMSPIVFGQFIDAKMIVEAGLRDEQDKWQVMQYVMAIFLIGKRKYDYLFTNETNSQFIRCGKRTLDVAIKFSKWWDLLNVYINTHYTLFQDSGDIREHCDNIDEHMKRWGWVNFLKSIAKTKAFDIAGSGMNSIDCVRATKASEILVWASEEKEDNVARNRDLKEAYKQ